MILKHMINCEISLYLTWSKKCIISSAVGITEFKITDIKLYFVKLLKQLKFDFKRTINWNKYHPKFKAFPQSRYLNYLIIFIIL